MYTKKLQEIEWKGQNLKRLRSKLAKTVPDCPFSESTFDTPFLSSIFAGELQKK